MRLLAISVALAMALGCGPRGAPAQTTAPEAGESQASAAPAEPLDARERLLAATLARARTIQDEVAAVRVLPFKRVVPAERQTREEFAKVVAREFARELPRSESEKASAALYHLGFLRTRIDLLEALSDATTTQVAAYYNPETGKFYAVSLSSDPVWLEVMTAHELTHGLQDQHFDLRAYYGQKPERELSEDQLNARRFVVEGEASFVMLLHMAAKQSGQLETMVAGDAPERAPLLAALYPQVRMMVAMIAGTPWQQLVEDTKKQAETISDNDADQVEAMDSIPPFILVPMLESYTRGALTVAQVHQAGGWDAVAALYTDPPDSTEQVLHPAEKLVKDRDYPTAIALPDYQAKYGEPLVDEVLGELGWRVYFETWEIAAAAEAAAGWDGDKVAVYKTPDGPLALMALNFDSGDDAREFAEAFAASLAARFPGEPSEKRGAAIRYPRPGGGGVLVRRRRRDVFIVDSAAKAAAAPAVLDELVAGTKQTPHPRGKE
jgi:hypothetical protein